MRTIDNYILEKLHLKKGIVSAQTKVLEELNKLGWNKLDEKEYKDSDVDLKYNVQGSMYNCSISDVISFIGEPTYINEITFDEKWKFASYMWVFENEDTKIKISTEAASKKLTHNMLFKFTTNNNKIDASKSISLFIDTLKNIAKDIPCMQEAKILNQIR